MHSRLLRVFTTAVLLSAMLLLLACNDSVSPNLEIDRAFSLWGILNAKSDTQAVRVFEIDDQLRLISPNPIDALVRSIDLETGEIRVWRDSVIQLNDGDFRHVFWDEFPVVAGRTYRIEAQKSDGRISSAETTVPPPILIEAIEPNSQLVLETRQTIRLHGDAPSLVRVDVRYWTVSIDAQGNTTEIYTTIPYEAHAKRKSDGWEIEVDYYRDYRQIVVEYERLEVSPMLIGFRGIEMQVHVGDEQWKSPTGAFEAEALVEPNVFTNVENGFGFVGSGYLEKFAWDPPQQVITRAGFGAQ